MKVRAARWSVRLLLAIAVAFGVLFAAIAVVSLWAASEERSNHMVPISPVTVVVRRPATRLPPPRASTPVVQPSPAPPIEMAALPSFSDAIAFCKELGTEPHSSPLFDGTPRFTGTNKSHDLNCEIVGKPSVESVGLLLPSIEGPHRAAAVQAFMRLARWGGGEAWFWAGLRTNDQKTTTGDVVFTMHQRDDVVTLDMERLGDRH